MLNKNRRRNETFFSSCLVDNDILYFLSDFSFIPFKYDLQTGKADCLVKDEDIEKLGNGNPEKIYIEKDQLFAVKNTGKEIIRISLKDKTYEKIDLNADYLATDNFALITKNESFMFCFCRTASKVIVFNCDKLELKEIELLILSDEGYRIGVREGQNVYLFTKSGKSFLKFNLIDYSFSIESMQTPFGCISNVNVTKAYIYILERKGTLTILNRQTYDVIKTVEVGKEAEYGFIVICNNKILLLPILGDNILIADFLFEEIETYKEYPGDFFYDDQVGPTKSKYYYPFEDNQYYYFAKRKANYFLKIEKETANLIWVSIEDAVYRTKINAEVHSGKICHENSYLEISDFMSVI